MFEQASDEGDIDGVVNDRSWKTLMSVEEYIEASAVLCIDAITVLDSNIGTDSGRYLNDA